MQHTQLSDADYRAAVKAWVMKQPDDRTYDFGSYNDCIVGQFLNDHPEFGDKKERQYTRSSVWSATHGDSTIINYEHFVAGEVLTPYDTFEGVKAAMKCHPMWAGL